MLSGKLLSSVLAARDGRQEALDRVVGGGFRATVFLSLNIPGVDKTPTGTKALFEWILGELSRVFPTALMFDRAEDALGPYAIMAFDVEPGEAKRCCIGLEASHPCARLIDLDVYSGQGIQIDRSSLNLPGRNCLVCKQPAVECIRVKRHSLDEVMGRVNELLAHFAT